MKKSTWAFLGLLSSSIFKGLKADHTGQLELTKLRLALMYIRSVKTFRLLFISLFGMGVCLVLLLAGLILFHVTLFLYAPWDGATKMMVGLLGSVVYLSATAVMLSQIFSSDKWLKIFNAETIIDHLRKEASSGDTIESVNKGPIANNL
jgi:hypothetical protein